MNTQPLLGRDLLNMLAPALGLDDNVMSITITADINNTAIITVTRRMAEGEGEAVAEMLRMSE